VAPVRAGLIDYEAGNLRSIGRALRLAGTEPVLIDRPVQGAGIDLLVLPGVGAFGAAMRRLHAAGLAEWLRAQVADGVPLAGVCLGMQLLYERSEEGGDVEGLMLLRGRVRRLTAGVKIPHMGWNQLRFQQSSPLLEGVRDGAHVYFVHSYVVEPADFREVLAVTSYGGGFPAMVRRERITGWQFHPEKSGDTGLRLLRNLVASAVA